MLDHPHDEGDLVVVGAVAATAGGAETVEPFEVAVGEALHLRLALARVARVGDERLLLVSVLVLPRLRERGRAERFVAPRLLALGCELVAGDGGVSEVVAVEWGQHASGRGRRAACPLQAKQLRRRGDLRLQHAHVAVGQRGGLIRGERMLRRTARNRRHNRVSGDSLVTIATIARVRVNVEVAHRVLSAVAFNTFRAHSEKLSPRIAAATFHARTSGSVARMFACFRSLPPLPPTALTGTILRYHPYHCNHAW